MKGLSEIRKRLNQNREEGWFAKIDRKRERERERERAPVAEWLERALACSRSWFRFPAVLDTKTFVS